MLRCGAHGEERSPVASGLPGRRMRRPPARKNRARFRVDSRTTSSRRGGTHSRDTIYTSRSQRTSGRSAGPRKFERCKRRSTRAAPKQLHAGSRGARRTSSDASTRLADTASDYASILRRLQMPPTSKRALQVLASRCFAQHS